MRKRAFLYFRWPCDKGESYPVVKEVDGKWFWCPQSTSIIHPNTTNVKQFTSHPSTSLMYDSITALLAKAPQILDREKSLLLFKQIQGSVGKIPRKEISKKNATEISETLKKIISEDKMDQFKEVLMEMKSIKKVKVVEAKADDGEQHSKSRKRASDRDNPEEGDKEPRKRKAKNTDPENEQKGIGKKSRKGKKTRQKNLQRKMN